MGTNAVADSELEVGGGALKKKIARAKYQIASAMWAWAFVQKSAEWPGPPGLLRLRPLLWIRHYNVVTSTEKLQIVIVYL